MRREVCDGIGEYFSGVITASVAVSLIGMVLPSDGESSVRRTADLLISVFLVAIILAPLGTLLGNISEKIDGIGNSIILPDDAENDLSGLYDSLESVSRAEIEETLNRCLCEQFGLPENGVSVSASVSAEGGEVKIIVVTVYLHGAAMWEDPHKIKEYIVELTDAPCEVVTGR